LKKIRIFCTSETAPIDTQSNLGHTLVTHTKDLSACLRKSPARISAGPRIAAPHVEVLALFGSVAAVRMAMYARQVRGNRGEL
jgi:hypothetical protein